MQVTTLQDVVKANGEVRWPAGETLDYPKEVLKSISRDSGIKFDELFVDPEAAAREGVDSFIAKQEAETGRTKTGKKGATR
jgi:hypothetical protein